MTAPALTPLNDYAIQVYIEHLDPATGVIGPLTAGTLTAFFATSNDPAATPAQPSWSVSGVYIGGANNYPPGTWQFEWDGSLLDIANCDTAFLTIAKAFIIIQRLGSIRRVLQIGYKRFFQATLAS